MKTIVLMFIIYFSIGWVTDKLIDQLIVVGGIAVWVLVIWVILKICKRIF